VIVKIFLVYVLAHNRIEKPACVM